MKDNKCNVVYAARLNECFHHVVLRIGRIVNFKASNYQKSICEIQ